MIILSAAEAEAVRGETLPGFALDPMPLKDGSFALPPRVLADPYHADHRVFLAPLPVRAVAEAEWLVEDAEPAEREPPALPSG